MIHIFLGTKAQLIKMAPIMRALQDQGIEYNFIFSGQHKETIDDLRGNFGVKAPDVVLHNGGDITSITKMLFWSIKLTIYTLLNRKKVWQEDRKGIVLNHGDTFSTFLGALLGKLAGHKTGHIESGLRSFNLCHPFPEELTRLLVFRLSDYYYAPGQWAADNLQNYRGEIVNTQANSLYDALQTIRALPTPPDLDIPGHKYAVVSLHRFENLAKKKVMCHIIELLEQVSEEIHLLFILHKPTLKRLQETGLIAHLENNPRIALRPRYDYLRFIALIERAEFVITDGGSNQEECHYLGKPCLIFRHKSERQEGLDSNAVLSNLDPKLVSLFVEGYKQRERSPLLLNSTPTQIIVHHLQSL